MGCQDRGEYHGTRHCGSIVPPENPSQPEKAHVSLGGPDSHRTFRIARRLNGEKGDEVALKKRPHVEITVTDQSET